MASRSFATAANPRRNALMIAAGAGLVAAVLVLVLLHDWRVSAGFLAAGLVLGGGLVAARQLFPAASPAVAEPDWGLAAGLADAAGDALAVTDRAGRLVCANLVYQERFSGLPTPPNLPLDAAALAVLGDLGRAAWRDGEASGALPEAGRSHVQVSRVGSADDLLIWRFASPDELSAAREIEGLIAGAQGDRLGVAGIMAALIAADGTIRGANRVFRARALGQPEGTIEGRDFARFLTTDDRGLVRFEREGDEGTPLRVLQIPFVDGADAPILVALLDEEASAPAASIQTRRHSTRAISSSARTRRRWPTPCGALPVVPRTRPTWRSG